MIPSFAPRMRSGRYLPTRARRVAGAASCRSDRPFTSLHPGSGGSPALPAVRSQSTEHRFRHAGAPVRRPPQDDKSSAGARSRRAIGGPAPEAGSPAACLADKLRRKAGVELCDFQRPGVGWKNVRGQVITGAQHSGTLSCASEPFNAGVLTSARYRNTLRGSPLSPGWMTVSKGQERGMNAIAVEDLSLTGC